MPQILHKMKCMENISKLKEKKKDKGGNKGNCTQNTTTDVYNKIRIVWKEIKGNEEDNWWRIKYLIITMKL